jgi:predicted nucleotidyltransferase
MVKRKSEINKIIKKVLALISNDIEVDAAILFGSYANGKPHEFSDIDLAVFSKSVEKWTLHEKIKFASKVKETEPTVELHLYSFKALRDARPTNFYGHIIETGKKVA